MNTLRMFSCLVLASLLIASSTLAQLPADLKDSDLGPGVPAMRVRPGYRVTRALPDKQLKDESRFLEFSDDGKTLFVSFRDPGYILALRDPDADGVFKTSRLRQGPPIRPRHGLPQRLALLLAGRRRLGLPRARYERRRCRRRRRVRPARRLRAERRRAPVRRPARHRHDDLPDVQRPDEHDAGARVRAQDDLRVRRRREEQARVLPRRAQRRKTPLPPGHAGDLGLRSRLGQLRPAVRREDRQGPADHRPPAARGVQQVRRGRLLRPPVFFRQPRPAPGVRRPQGFHRAGEQDDPAGMERARALGGARLHVRREGSLRRGPPGRRLLRRPRQLEQHQAGRRVRRSASSSTT